MRGREARGERAEGEGTGLPATDSSVRLCTLRSCASAFHPWDPTFPPHASHSTPYPLRHTRSHVGRRPSTDRLRRRASGHLQGGLPQGQAKERQHEYHLLLELGRLTSLCPPGGLCAQETRAPHTKKLDKTRQNTRASHHKTPPVPTTVPKDPSTALPTLPIACVRILDLLPT